MDFITIVFFIKSARLKRRKLTVDDVNQIKEVTPPLKKGSSKMFRTLRDKGEKNSNETSY